jgi:hypothetical protein
MKVFKLLYFVISEKNKSSKMNYAEKNPKNRSWNQIRKFDKMI